MRLVPEKDEDFYKMVEIDILARTLWGEARGDGAIGMQAVANVILNRVAIAREEGKFWWGNNIVQVCQKPYQFSCWNRSDPNFKRLQNVDETDENFKLALALARKAVAGCLADHTNGATHYHMGKYSPPYWASKESPCAVVGGHIFYKIT